jgi:hypothetical protein
MTTPIALVFGDEAVESGYSPRHIVIGTDRGTQIAGSSLAESADEPTRSQNITVSLRRSATSIRGDVIASS